MPLIFYASITFKHHLKCTFIRIVPVSYTYCIVSDIWQYISLIYIDQFIAWLIDER